MSHMPVAIKAACLLTVCVLAGCAPAQVRDVVANQADYLATHFSPEALPASVRDTIMQADHGPVGFRKMFLLIDFETRSSSKTDAGHARSKLTLINAGGSFVQKRSEYSRNGTPVIQDDDLTYRGLLTLRSQSFSMKARHGGIIITAHKLTRFDPIELAAAKLDYDYTVGVPTQYAHFAEHRMACEMGNAYPAARIFASFAGAARDIECDWYNSNGVLAGKARLAYLQQYGVAIQLDETESWGIAHGTVVSADIE